MAPQLLGNSPVALKRDQSFHHFHCLLKRHPLMFGTQVINCQLSETKLERNERNLRHIPLRIFPVEYSNRNNAKTQEKCLTETGQNPT
jgi:hypothetical protein